MISNIQFEIDIESDDDSSCGDDDDDDYNNERINDIFDKIIITRDNASKLLIHKRITLTKKKLRSFKTFEEFFENHFYKFNNNFIKCCLLSTYKNNNNNNNNNKLFLNKKKMNMLKEFNRYVNEKKWEELLLPIQIKVEKNKQKLKFFRRIITKLSENINKIIEKSEEEEEEEEEEKEKEKEKGIKNSSYYDDIFMNQNKMNKVINYLLSNECKTKRSVIIYSKWKQKITQMFPNELKISVAFIIYKVVFENSKLNVHLKDYSLNHLLRNIKKRRFPIPIFEEDEIDFKKIFKKHKQIVELIFKDTRIQCVFKNYIKNVNKSNKRKRNNTNGDENEENYSKNKKRRKI